MCRERFFRQRVETSKWGPKSSVKWDPRLFWGYLLSYTGLFFTSHLYSWLLITLLNSAKLRLLENISITCARPKVIVKCYLNQHRTMTDWQENHLKFGFGGPERVCVTKLVTVIVTHNNVTLASSPIACFCLHSLVLWFFCTASCPR